MNLDDTGYHTLFKNRQSSGLDLVGCNAQSVDCGDVDFSWRLKELAREGNPFKVGLGFGGVGNAGGQ